jgi:2-amino-4-hydroxy-6-hydroxymethyldihydropteridine diphosphokinase
LSAAKGAESVARVYVSIGSNIERERNIQGALAALGQSFGALQQSRIYETQAVGFDGDPFYNLVVGFDTEQTPQQVAAVLSRIEDAHGRDRRSGKFSSRTLDLDLLLYDDRVLDEAGLHLPRKEILEYAFVLKPLAEIAGNAKHPVTGFTFAAHWDQFDPTAQPMRPVDRR